MPRGTINRSYPDELVIDSNIGYSKWGGPFHYESGFWAPRGKLYKQYAISGDHHGPTPYSMEETFVTSDTPRRYRYLVQNPYDGVIQDSIYTEYISRKVTNPLFWNFPDAYLTQVSNAGSRSITTALNNLRQKDSMELGAAVGEIKKTGDMLASPAIQLWKGMLAARAGRWGEIPGHLGMNVRDVLYGRYPANKWLEYQYGWKPLVSDCYSAYGRLFNAAQEDPTIYGSCRSPVEYSTQSEGYYTVKSKWSGGVSCKICAVIQGSWLREMESWGLTNPLSISWELMPFSFMVDWGIPIGNVLSALTATAGLQFQWGYVSTKRHGLVEVTTPYADPGYEWGETIIDAGRFAFQKTAFDRTLTGGFPLPQLYGEQSPFSTARIKNAIAIGRQLFTGRP